MAKSFRLTDEQHSQIRAASYALDNPETFTRRVHEHLRTAPELGDGLVYRVCRSLEPQFFDPPSDLAENGNHRPQLFRKKLDRAVHRVLVLRASREPARKCRRAASPARGV